MRPLFAIVPLVALLAWLGEPQPADVATAAEASSPAITHAISSQHRTLVNTPSLGASLVSARAPATAGTPHLMSTSWAPAR